MPSALSYTVLMGTTVPKPIPALLVEAIESLEITHQIQGRSGFQIVFQAGRSDASGSVDDALLSDDLLQPFNRVIVSMTFNAMPRIVLDGIITHQEFSPSPEPGETRITITGEDVSVMMDLEEKSVEHVGLDDRMIVNQLLLSYAKYGLVPQVKAPVVSDRPLPTERTPVQLGTDLEYIRQLADRNGFLFYITPGPMIGQNTAYWGPPQPPAPAPKPLLVNMQGSSTVESINFQYDALAPTRMVGRGQDRKTNQVQPISILQSTRSPLSQNPALTRQLHTKTTQFRESGNLNTVASARAQARVDRSTDGVITATGELDTVRYGDLLQAGKVVGLAGVGRTYDGWYYVKQVTHQIREGETRQRFTLIREGVNILL